MENFVIHIQNLVDHRLSDFNRLFNRNQGTDITELERKLHFQALITGRASFYFHSALSVSELP